MINIIGGGSISGDLYKLILSVFLVPMRLCGSQIDNVFLMQTAQLFR